MSFRSFGQHGLAFLLALSVSACLSDSEKSGSENVGISLAIISPTSASTMDTVDPTVSLAGNANSPMGIFKVTWANDRGGEGIANGSVSWQIAGIALKLGVNRITVSVEDNAGAKTSKGIAVFKESGQPGTATLSWTAPIARTDGTPLTNLAGYKIRYGRMSGVYDYQVDIDNSGVVAYVVENLVPGDWYFALTAYDTGGSESDRSNEVLRQIN